MMTTAILLTALLGRGSGFLEFTWTPAKGETSVWNVSIKGTAGGKAVQADSSVAHEVTRVDKEEVVVKSTVQDALARTGADEGKLKRPEPTTYTMDRHGAVVKIDGPQKDAAWRLAPFNHFVWPTGSVTPGSTWSANLVGATAAGRADYTLDSIDGNMAKVTFAAASLAGNQVTKGRGFWIIDLKSGRATTLHAEIDGLMDGKASYDMTLVK